MQNRIKITGEAQELDALRETALQYNALEAKRRTCQKLGLVHMAKDIEKQRQALLTKMNETRNALMKNLNRRERTAHEGIKRIY